MSREKKYWKSEVELSNSVDITDLKHNEFQEKLPIDLETVSYTHLRAHET